MASTATDRGLLSWPRAVPHEPMICTLLNNLLVIGASFEGDDPQPAPASTISIAAATAEKLRTLVDLLRRFAIIVPKRHTARGAIARANSIRQSAFNCVLVP